MLGKQYAIPSDNPFVNQADALGEIWAYGLRNPYRFSFDKVTGKMWVGDVGGAVSTLIRYSKLELLLDYRKIWSSFGTVN